jgi:hypothetical protein
MITNPGVGEYQPPLIENKPNTLIANNQLSLGLGEGRIDLGLYPHFFICNQCGYVGDTQIYGECDCLNCCGYFCCSNLYLLYTIISLKDFITFMSVKHTCPKCGKLIGIYKTF